MLPYIHLLTSIIAIIFLFPIYKYLSLAFLIGGFLIDFDHYLWWVIERRKYNPIKCYKELIEESKKNNEYFKSIKKRPFYVNFDKLHIFHVWEFWILMILLSFIHKFFLIITLGIFFHLALDFAEMFYNRVYGQRAISFFYWLKRTKLKE